MSATKRVLVSYYSMTGNTARVARDLAKKLGADVESIQDRSHGTGFFNLVQAAFHALRGKPAAIASLHYDPADYDITIIGTPVWVGRITPAVRAYLQRKSSAFRNVAFFVTSGGTDVAKLVPTFESVAGHVARASAGFDQRELRDASEYERKLTAFVSEIEHGDSSASSARVTAANFVTS